jgi:hypothetical protein
MMIKTLGEKIVMHKQFWQGKGPCLILITTPELASLDPGTETLDKYDTAGYNERFYAPQKMWESEMRRAREVLDWPTDGIPTVRPNLGTVFIPAMAGQEIRLPENQMPHAGASLAFQQILEIDIDSVPESDMMQRARAFYALHAGSDESGIAAYHADTQGIFDLAHLLYGDTLFLDMAMQEAKVNSVLEVCSKLYIQVSRHLKSTLSEPKTSMIHGHGTPQGLFFPYTGVRMSEDSTTLISPKMIEKVVLPHIVTAARLFGGVFIHYCGKHNDLFEMLCKLDCVHAIDLGNPEAYDLEWLMTLCAQTGTVFYSRVAPESNNESWEAYIRRIAKIQNRTHARCVLRTLIQPFDPQECLEMLKMWHELTLE